MKATDFEYRHQTLAHQVIGGAAFLALLDRDDVVWRLIKDSATPHRLERFIFIITTLLIATCGGNLQRGPAPTAAKRQQGWRTPCLAFPSAVSRRTMLCPRLGFSRSSWGFVLLVVGEALRVFAGSAVMHRTRSIFRSPIVDRWHVPPQKSPIVVGERPSVMRQSKWES